LSSSRIFSVDMIFATLSVRRSRSLKAVSPSFQNLKKYTKCLGLRISDGLNLAFMHMDGRDDDIPLAIVP